MRNILVFVLSFILVPLIASEILCCLSNLDKQIIWMVCSLSFLILYALKSIWLKHVIKDKNKWTNAGIFVAVYIVVCLMMVWMLK